MSDLDPLVALARQLADIGRRAVGAGLVVGAGGNLSARLPGASQIVVTAAGAWLDRLDADAFSRVCLADSAVVAGNPNPTTEIALHVLSYRARPDVNAVVHLHPQACILVDALGEPIACVTTDHAAYVRQVARVPYLPPGSHELAAAAAAAVAGGVNCAILAHHGCSVLAENVDLAYARAANLEEAARATLACRQLGRVPPPCPPEFLEMITAGEAGGRVTSI